ncbi:hypothetical protein GCM10027521_61810 [Amycolatopsis cihanbeyliensis]
MGEGAHSKPTLDNPVGDGCSWSKRDGSGARIGLELPTITDDGLAAIYRQRGKAYKFFEEMPDVEGYPAVTYGPRDEREQGYCAVAVGTSDKRTVQIFSRLSEWNRGKKDPCQAAHDTAVEVVKNVKGGQ